MLDFLTTHDQRLTRRSLGEWQALNYGFVRDLRTRIETINGNHGANRDGIGAEERMADDQNFDLNTEEEPKQRATPLFGPGSHPGRDSLINLNAGMKHDILAFGYFNAGYQLANNAIFSIDLDVYPILFLFRHALELQLKITLWRHNRYEANEEQWPPRGHGLKRLMGEVRGICPTYGIDANADDLKHAWWVIEEFIELDSSATHLRYRDQPVGANSLDEIERIDVQRVAEEVRKAWFALGSIDEQIQMRMEDRSIQRAHQLRPGKSERR